MTTTNALSTMLQAYYQQKIQGATAAVQARLGATAPSGAAKTDTATISSEALQALLASEQSSDPWGSSTGQDLSAAGSADASTPTGITPEQAIQQAQQAMRQAEQSFLDTLGGSPSDRSGQSDDDPSAMMTAYTRTLEAQISETIKAAQARMTQLGS